jgi:hypothetical protein
MKYTLRLADHNKVTKLKFRPPTFRIYLLQSSAIIWLNIKAYYVRRSQYAFQACRRETTNTKTMAVATKNVSLLPHMNFNFRRIRVGLIGDNAPSKQICFSLAMSWSKAFKTLRWFGNDGDESCLAIGVF